MPSRALLVAAAVRQTTTQCTTNSRSLTEGCSYRSNHTSSAPRHPNVNSPGTSTPVANSHHPVSSLGGPLSSSPPSSPLPASHLHLPSPSSPVNFDIQGTHPRRRNTFPARAMQSTPQRMFSGNSEWRSYVEQEMGPDFFKDLAKGQSPKLLWIGCADSRVPETIVMAAK